MLDADSSGEWIWYILSGRTLRTWRALLDLPDREYSHNVVVPRVALGTLSLSVNSELVLFQDAML